MEMEGELGVYGWIPSVNITEIADQKENSDILMSLWSIFSINDTRQRLKRKRYTQGYGVIWGSEGLGVYGGFLSVILAS